MTEQALSSNQSPATEPLLTPARKSFEQHWFREKGEAANLNSCHGCLETPTTKVRRRSRMSTAATESAFEWDPCDLADSDARKALVYESEALGSGDDQSSTDEGSMPEAFGTEASEDTPELTEGCDRRAPPSVAASATSHSRSFLLDVYAKLSSDMLQTSVPPLGSEALPKTMAVNVPTEVDRATANVAEATNRGPIEGAVTGNNAESPMTVDSPEAGTIMLRNIPNRISCVTITKQLDVHGFGGTYDLVYVPIDRTTGNLNLGYAFVNFRDKANCSRFTDAFNGKCAKVLFPQSSSRKILVIALASVQGRDAYWKRLSSFVWPLGSGAWQPLILDDDGRRIKLPVGRPHVTPPANFQNAEWAAAAACAASRNLCLRAEAPEFVPGSSFPVSEEYDYDANGILDHHLLTPICDAQFHGPPGLSRDASLFHYQSPVFDCIQPEMHMAALAKATKYAQSLSGQATSQRSMGLISCDPSDATRATMATEVLTAGCEQQSKAKVLVAEDEPTNAVISEKPCATDVSARSSRSVTAAKVASAFVTGFLLASSLGLSRR